MHVGLKIIGAIRSSLDNIYSINISEDEWEIFTQPLENEDDEVVNRHAFITRQEISINILNRILSIHEKEEIVRFIARLALIEPNIQEILPWVRDHVVHAINTFITGAYILENVTFPPLRRTRFGYPFMWKLCGPTHDLGYPIEIGHNINSTFLGEMNRILHDLGSLSPAISQEIYPYNLDVLSDQRNASTIIQNRLNDWCLGIEINNYFDWLRLKNISDHGIISALSQMKVFDAIYKKYNPNREYININSISGHNYNQENFDSDLVSSCSALFIHNIDSSYTGFPNKISFDMAPIAFLLYLCDNFQEWDRYSEKREIFSGDQFDIICTQNSIALLVPEKLEDKIISALSLRLSGLLVTVNGKIAVS